MCSWIVFKENLLSIMLISTVTGVHFRNIFCFVFIRMDSDILRFLNDAILANSRGGPK